LCSFFFPFTFFFGFFPSSFLSTPVANGSFLLSLSHDVVDEGRRQAATHGCLQVARRGEGGSQRVARPSRGGAARRAVPRSGVRCPQSLSTRGGRQHAYRGKENAVLGCRRRKKGGALAVVTLVRCFLVGLVRRSCVEEVQRGGAAQRKRRPRLHRSPAPNRLHRPADNLQAPHRRLASAVFCLGAGVKAVVGPCEDSGRRNPL
jgi:hypothetical protein